MNKNNTANLDHLAQDFVKFALECGVLGFGEFKTKAGRMSPYFFNAGLFDDGAKLGKLAEFYAKSLIASGIEFDMIFGPAYKGIPLGAAVAVELARQGRNVPFAYNRKEAKDHGEGGTLVGAKLQGRVLIVDDVMSAGTATRESIALIKAAGATPAAVAIALDRQEKATEKDATWCSCRRPLQRRAVRPQPAGHAGLHDCQFEGFAGLPSHDRRPRAAGA